MSKRKSNRGFSLIELLVCIAILAIIMVMIGSFVTTTLTTNRKTKKELQVQDESQRIFYQVADILMQATYIRVSVKDGGEVYEYDSTDNKFKEISTVDIATGAVDLVPDNYANYEAGLGYDSQKVIVDFDEYDILNEAGKIYPAACGDLLTAVKKLDSSKTSLVDDSDATSTSLLLKSFRTLTRQYFKITSGTLQEYSKSYYVVPQYIYVEYSRSNTKFSTTPKSITDGTTTVTVDVVDKDSTSNDTGCVMFKYEPTERKIYMYRAPAEKQVPEDINYEEAKSAIDAAGYDSYISANIAEFYLSADPDANSINLGMMVEDEKYVGFRYNMNETINIRNNNVLTVKPQLLRKKKGTGNMKKEPTASGSSGGSADPAGTGGSE